ncbi:hypothetical protein [Desulfopila sp. IMCC35008]|nr:hypothetical protein [Desulfopila sp. IMCC35008]
MEIRQNDAESTASTARLSIIIDTLMIIVMSFAISIFVTPAITGPV